MAAVVFCSVISCHQLAAGENNRQICGLGGLCQEEINVTFPDVMLWNSNYGAGEI